MTDQERKGAEVTVLTGATIREDRYPNAADVKVTDGHLLVLDEENYRIGVYAPGKWAKVQMHR